MRTISTLALGAVLMGAASQAMSKNTTYNIGVVSDYVYRGISQTDNGVALQGGADYKVGNAYAGAWFSNVEEQDDSEGIPVEMDVYFGYNHKFGGFNLDTSIKTYNYLNDTNGDLTEFRLATNPIKGLEIGINREVKSKFWYPEVNYERFLPHRLYLDLHAGYWNIDDADDNALDFRAELARDFPELHHIDFFIAASHITDSTPGGDDADEDDAETLFLFGVRKNF